MPVKRLHERAPELDGLRRESELERTTREMFARWGEWRVAAPEDQERARRAIEDAETAYERAREVILRPPATHMPPDFQTLRGVVLRLTRALAQNNVSPSDVVHLL